MSTFGRLESGRVTISDMEFSSMLSTSRNPEVHCFSPAKKKQAYVFNIYNIDQLWTVINMTRPSVLTWVRNRGTTTL